MENHVFVESVKVCIVWCLLRAPFDVIEVHLHSRLLSLSMSVYGLHFQQFLSFWFTYSAVSYVQECSVFGSHIQQFCMSRGVKKKKILSRTRVFKTRVHTGEIFSSDALFRPRAYKNRASGEKKFPQ